MKPALKKAQRKTLDSLIESFESMKSTLSESTEPTTNDIGDAKTQLMNLRDEIDEAHANLSDRAQESDRGQAMQKAIDDFDDADEYLENALEHVRNAIEAIGNAIEAMQAATGDET